MLKSAKADAESFEEEALYIADWRDHTKIQKRKKYDAGGDGKAAGRHTACG